MMNRRLFHESLFFLGAILVVPLAPVAQENQSPVLNAETIVERSLRPMEVPYSGLMSVKSSGETGSDGQVRVDYAPGGRLKHEILNNLGQVARVIVSDGKKEWIFDREKGKVWTRPLPNTSDHSRRFQEIGLLKKNFQFQLIQEGKVAGRPVWEIEVISKGEGKTVRRLWVDRQYFLLLRAESVGRDGKVSGSMQFKELRIPASVADENFKFTPPNGVKVVESPYLPDALNLEDLNKRSGIVPRIPEWVPPGYSLEDLGSIPYHGASILQYHFSDGIDVLSLFQMPAKVRFKHHEPPMARLNLKGTRARLYSDLGDNLLEWRSGEDRFVLIGQSSARAMRQVAESIR